MQDIQMLMVVLNRVEKLSDLLDAFMERGLCGATILKSNGIVKLLGKNIEHYPIFGSLRHVLDDGGERKDSRTIFMILKEDKVEAAKAAVREIVGDLNEPDTAIMLTLPVISAEGVGF